jgi:hypothetical protein
MKKQLLLIATLLIISNIHAGDPFTMMAAGGMAKDMMPKNLTFAPNLNLNFQTIKQNQDQAINTRTGKTTIKAGGNVAYQEGNIATQAGQSQSAAFGKAGDIQTFIFDKNKVFVLNNGKPLTGQLESLAVVPKPGDENIYVSEFSLPDKRTIQLAFRSRKLDNLALAKSEGFERRFLEAQQQGRNLILFETWAKVTPQIEGLQPNQFVQLNSIAFGEDQIGTRPAFKVNEKADFAEAVKIQGGVAVAHQNIYDNALAALPEELRAVFSQTVSDQSR